MRSIDAPDLADRPPSMDLILARGPFNQVAERELMKAHRVDVIVTKNSGGSATDAKLAAARDLGLPVIMIDRPIMPESRIVYDLEDIMAFIHTHSMAP
jgi:precorrin-6A/cobalt-precorrin-6A reductase